MVDIGELVQRLGIWLFVGGFGIQLGLTVVRIVASFGKRAWLVPMLVIGYYARAVGMVGLVVIIIGSIMRGNVEWWMLLVILALGGGTAIAILVTRPVTTDNPFGMNSRDGHKR